MVRSRPTYSLEFFAPKTPEGAARLRLVWPSLGALAPAYFSVTCPTDEGGPALLTRQEPRAPHQHRELHRTAGSVARHSH